MAGARCWYQPRVRSTIRTTEMEHWLTAAGFVEIRITVRQESRELVKTWAPGRGIENYVASAAIEARKPGSAAL
jgi:arsenite methyltransferase